MANRIVLKKSSVAAKVPLTTDLEYGELALNYLDEKLYFKNSSNVVKSFSAVDWTKRAVKVATTANITLSGTQTIDGVAVVAGDRVLVKDQTTASQNGIYVVAAGAWARAAGADTSLEMAGSVVAVESGTVNGGIHFDTDFKSTDTLGTTANNWYKVYDTFDAATANTASKLVLRDASGNFSAGTITAALSGNASTATTLQTARTINGVSFNGSANITITSNTTNALTIGTGLSGTSFNGSAAVTIAIDSSVVTLTGTQTLTNKTLTSPTLTTPNIGAATGTSLSVSGSFTSTVATGTAPLVVSSTTKVNNLNAEMVDGYHATTSNTASTIAVRDASGEVLASGFSASGGMFEHANVISANYAINSGNNAISAGPVTVANGVTVTIPTGSTWVIV